MNLLNTLVELGKKLTRMDESGKLSVPNNPKINEQYAADVPEFKGKNVAAIFKTKPAPQQSSLPMTPS